MPVEQEGTPCVLCGQSNKTVVFEATDYITQDRFRLLQCQTCHLVETSPQLDLTEMIRYYPDEYFGLSGRRFLGPGEQVIRLARVWRAEAIHRFCRAPGRSLDIGCGRGWMLTKLKQMGWECYGTEWSEMLVRRHQQNGLHVLHEPDLRDCHFPDRFFDAITLWHVFEHIPNPSHILAEIHRIMKPGGLIVVATPDFGGLVSRLARQSWFALDVPRHLYHYSGQTLPAMVERTGFRVFRRRTLSVEQDIFGCAQSVMNAMGFGFNKLYNSIRANGAKADAPIGAGILADGPVFWGLALTLLTLSVPLSLLLSLLRTGGTIEVWATKPVETRTATDAAPK